MFGELLRFDVGVYALRLPSSFRMHARVRADSLATGGAGDAVRDGKWRVNDTRTTTMRADGGRDDGRADTGHSIASRARILSANQRGVYSMICARFFLGGGEGVSFWAERYTI